MTTDYDRTWYETLKKKVMETPENWSMWIETGSENVEYRMKFVRFFL